MQDRLFNLAANHGVKVEVIYEGETFTLVTATLVLQGGESDSKGRTSWVGEGIARRCYRDKCNPDLGISIATGRALRALNDKIAGLRQKRHPRRFVDIMRG